MPAKLAIDRAYLERWSLWLDLKILAATALATFRLEGVIDLEREAAALRRKDDYAPHNPQVGQHLRTQLRPHGKADDRGVTPA
jgi:hypothetical protein